MKTLLTREGDVYPREVRSTLASPIMERRSGGERPTHAKEARQAIRRLAATIPAAAYLIVCAQELLWCYGEPKFFFMASWSWLGSFCSLLMEVATTVLVFLFAEALTRNHPRWGTFLRLSLAGLLAILLFVRWSAHAPLDFYLLAENLGIVFYRESLELLASKVSFSAWWVGLSACLVVFLLDWSTRRMVRRSDTRSYWRPIAIYASLLLTVLATPMYYHNDLSYVLRTGMEYCFGRHAYPGATTVSGYPYVKEPASAQEERWTPSLPIQDTNGMPHVFLIQMESFAADFVRAKNKAGEQYTPFFNALTEEGLYVERFYGNSIQSCRGQLATWCSIFPSIQDKIFTHYPTLRVKSIAHILNSAGYRTLFCKAYRTLDFDNTGAFVHHIGFMESFAMDARFVTPEDAPFVWGWGIQDNRFYQKVFKYLDETSQSNVNKPCFVCMHTVSHHNTFNSVPPEQRHLYPTPHGKWQHFANSMFVADKYLEEFFVQLEQRPAFSNSIVIITGDHGYPTGQHGSFYNEQGYWEENFRTPFLLVWRGHMKPRIIRDRAYSQVDIAPTILDLLNIDAENHFCGRSMLADDKKRPVYLVQPYCGGYLCVVDYPLKYVRGMRTPEEYVFDLAQDPTESRNVIEKLRGTDALRTLMDGVSHMYTNQMLIEHDRIWPPEKRTDGALVYRASPRRADGGTAARPISNETARRNVRGVGYSSSRSVSKRP